MPLDATSRCNRTRITHSQLIRTLASTSELEGSQALLHKPPRLKGAQQLAQGRLVLGFIAPKQIEPLYPFTGHSAHQPDALVLTGRVRSLLDNHVSRPFESSHYRQQLTRSCAQHLLTRPDGPLTERTTLQSPIVNRDVPEMLFNDPMRLVLADRTRHSVRSRTPRCAV